MEDTSNDTFVSKPSKHITIGLVAHVDAGKTTLSEGFFYAAGNIQELGRVDNQNAFLDRSEERRVGKECM